MSPPPSAPPTALPSAPPTAPSSVMADKKPSLSSPAHHNGLVGGVVPKTHENGSLDPGPGPGPGHPSSASGSRRNFRNLGGFVTAGPGSEGGFATTRPRGQSFGSALISRARTTISRTMHRTNDIRTNQQKEPEALLDLILESQGQRLDDQRASFSLLPDPGPTALCGDCSLDQNSSLDFYYMLIHYQSDRMEDQRSSLPGFEDVLLSLPEGQEDFFSLVQRVQSRRMDEQRASMLRHNQDQDQDQDRAGSASQPHHLHHHHH